MTLEREIEKNAAVVSTESYSMSIGELISMYIDGELDLHPEFQRVFRWTPEQKSRLVESLLLGIPIPPVFVSERTDSKWDVIDGLQRLSTILELLGELLDETGNRLPPLTLTKTKYLPSLEGLTWGAKDSSRLPDVARIRLKRARIDVNILRQTSSELAKYEIFQRLNTGGSTATDQEVRNCVLIMIDPTFYKWVRGLAEHAGFGACIMMTDRALEEAYNLELVVRFLVLANAGADDLAQISELGAFLTDESVAMATSKQHDRISFANAFEKTFEFLAEHLGADSFRRYDPAGKRYLGPMLISLFEVVAIGFGRRLLTGQDLPDPDAFLRAHKKLWNNTRLSGYVGSGVNASRRISQTVTFGESWLK